VKRPDGSRSPKPYHAQAGDGNTRAAIAANGGKRKRWYGPSRATAEEAALDYCNHMNGQQAPPRPTLKSPPRQRTARSRISTARTKRIESLRKELRELEAQEKKARRGSRGFVYLVAEEHTPLRSPREKFILNEGVKIGWSQEMPDVKNGRLDGLQTGNLRPLILLGTIPGTVADEKALHAKHITANVRWEWFRPTPAVLSEFGWRIEWRGNTFYRIVKEAS
jgi:hypothetical protein